MLDQSIWVVIAENSNNSIDYIDIITLIISVISLVVATLHNRRQSSNQEYQTILEVMSRKAEICNSYIKPESNYIFPRYEEASVSAIVSNIITAYQIIHIKENNNNNDNKRLLDTFYLMLHTSIREYISSNTTYTSQTGNEKIQATIREQLEAIRLVFRSQIEKYG